MYGGTAKGKGMKKQDMMMGKKSAGMMPKKAAKKAAKKPMKRGM